MSVENILAVTDAPGSEMDAQTPFEHEVAQLLVATLQLEVTAEDIQPREALFHDGLGLDSIDALEIALALSRQYGVDIRSAEARESGMFASLRNLCAYLTQHRAR